MRLKEILKSSLDTSKTTVIPQLNIEFIKKDIPNHVLRVTQRVIDAIAVAKCINEFLVNSVINREEELYMKGQRYIKISSKYIAEIVKFSEKRVIASRRLLSKAGYIKFLNPFRRNSKWQNVWLVFLQPEAFHVENKMLEFSGNKDDFKVRDMTIVELADWSFIRKFKKYAQYGIPNEAVAKLDEKNSHLTKSPRSIFSRGGKKDEIKKEIQSYWNERNKLIRNADWTGVYQDFVIEHPELSSKSRINKTLLKGYVDPFAKYRTDGYYDEIDGDWFDIWVKEIYRPEEKRKSESINRNLLFKQLSFN